MYWSITLNRFKDNVVHFSEPRCISIPFGLIALRGSESPSSLSAINPYGLIEC